MAFRDEIVKRSNGTITSLPVSDFITGVATETSALDGADGTLSSLDVTAFINTVSHSFITSMLPAVLSLLFNLIMPVPLMVLVLLNNFCRFWLVCNDDLRFKTVCYSKQPWQQE